jgi:sporulation and spore germination protein
MSNWVRWLLGGLFGAVIIAALYFPVLSRHVKQTAVKTQPDTEEQARRDLSQTLTAPPTEPRVKANLFWAASANDGTLTPVTVDLQLSADPVLRAKQVLDTLLAGPVDVEHRTLPPDAVLLAFYLLPDGTGIADFSEALAISTPSGIASEQLAVDSIVHTLAANVPQILRLKILIHGQEVETLAGHLDLTNPFPVNPRLWSQNSSTPSNPPSLSPAPQIASRNANLSF